MDKEEQNKDRLNQKKPLIWRRRVELLSGILMLIGIVLTFFYFHLGSLLVGLAFGICFFDEIHTTFLELRDFYYEQGIFKTLMWMGIILYFLIAIPVFIIATAIGFGVMFLIRWSFKK